MYQQRRATRRSGGGCAEAAEAGQGPGLPYRRRLRQDQGHYLPHLEHGRRDRGDDGPALRGDGQCDESALREQGRAHNRIAEAWCPKSGLGLTALRPDYAARLAAPAASPSWYSPGWWRRY